MQQAAESPIEDKWTLAVTRGTMHSLAAILCTSRSQRATDVTSKGPIRVSVTHRGQLKLGHGLWARRTEVALGEKGASAGV